MQLISNSNIPVRKEDITCPITLDLFEDPITLPCNHSFSYSAIREWSYINNTCPICRNAFDINILDNINSIRNTSLQRLIKEYQKQQIDIKHKVASVIFTIALGVILAVEKHYPKRLTPLVGICLSNFIYPMHLYASVIGSFIFSFYHYVDEKSSIINKFTIASFSKITGDYLHNKKIGDISYITLSIAFLASILGEKKKLKELSSLANFAIHIPATIAFLAIGKIFNWQVSNPAFISTKS
jgi:hypothetical protein